MIEEFLKALSEIRNAAREDWVKNCVGKCKEDCPYCARFRVADAIFTVASTGKSNFPMYVCAHESRSLPMISFVGNEGIQIWAESQGLKSLFLEISQETSVNGWTVKRLA